MALVKLSDENFFNSNHVVSVLRQAGTIIVTLSTGKTENIVCKTEDEIAKVLSTFRDAMTRDETRD